MSKKTTKTDSKRQDRPLPQTAAKENLSCELTPDELRERGCTLAALIKAHAAAEAEKDLITKQHKTRVDAAAGKVAEMARIVDERKEDRMVDVLTVHDPYRATHETTRLDTGEVIRTRTMDRAEVNKLLQVEMPLDRPAPAGATDLLDANDDGAR